jgi:4-diphosphocytidyl-2-C-methyl-D-erythritol kinase
MMTFKAPAKINLSLHVGPRRGDGYHPLDSLVQTIDLCDTLTIAPTDGEDELVVSDEDLAIDDNLALQAIRAARTRLAIGKVTMTLEKQIPVGAGFGGGSSDAAAALIAACHMANVPTHSVEALAPALGADVALFLKGGTQRMTGIGEVLESLEPLFGFGVAMAVPDFRLSTPAVYGRWDELGGPTGPYAVVDKLPDAVRVHAPLRNDLLPAALDIEPRLGDFMFDLIQQWGRPVFLSGSGSGCFAYFSDAEEASAAAAQVDDSGVRAVGVGLRSTGAGRVD